jgi:hypothetical protein
MQSLQRDHSAGQGGGAQDARTSAGARLVKRMKMLSAPEGSGDLLKSLAIPAILAVLGFALGVASDFHKDRSAADRATKDTRSKTLVATASAFSGYLVNWSRLRTIAESEAEIQAELLKLQAARTTTPEVSSELASMKVTLAEVKSRKEKYVAARDLSKDELLRQLETGKIFFSPALLPQIEEFEHFDRGSSILELNKLPPMDEWRKKFGPVLKVMQEEVKHDES